MELTTASTIINIVSPAYCRELELAGLTERARFYYKVLDHVCILWTYEFDPDNYYLEGDKVLSHWENARKMPAYTFKELEKCLPNYYINKQDNLYSLSLDAEYGIPVLKNNRIEDLMAMGVLQLIRNRKIPVEHFNNLLLSSTV